MRNITIALESYTTIKEFELLEVSRRKQYVDGEATDNFDTVYKVLINFEPTEVRVDDDGKVMQRADEIHDFVQGGVPLRVTFEKCKLTISPKSQYELAIRGNAVKVNIHIDK